MPRRRDVQNQGVVGISRGQPILETVCKPGQAQAAAGGTMKKVAHILKMWHFLE